MIHWSRDPVKYEVHFQEKVQHANASVFTDVLLIIIFTNAQSRYYSDGFELSSRWSRILYVRTPVTYGYLLIYVFLICKQLQVGRWLHIIWNFFVGLHGVNGINFEGRPSKNIFLPLTMRWLSLTLFWMLKETYPQI